MKRWILILVSIAAVGGLIGWRLYSKNEAAQIQAQGRQAAAKAPPPVTVVPVASRDIIQTFVGVGSTTAPFNVRVAPKISGRLDFLQVREGAPVKLGDVLARIDPSQILAQVSQQQSTIAEAQSRLAEAQLTRNPAIVNVNTQIQQQVSAVASARADYDQVRQNYNSQVAAARAAVTDAQGRIDNATATIGNADANIRSAQANLNNAQIRYNRTYDLYKQGFVAAQDVDDVNTTVKVQDAALGVAQGQRQSAVAARDSAVAQKSAAQEQADIVTVKGKADIAAAAAKVQQANAALKYARSNVAQKPAYEQNLAALRASVSAAQAQLRNLQSQLSDTTLRSPINGFVTARYVDPGAIVSPSQPVVAVQAIKNIFVDTSVPEDVIRHLHVGQSTTTVFDALPGRTYRGAITQMTPAADPQSRQFPVRISLPNEDNAIKPGMFGRVTVVTQRIPGALVVPREAIQRGKNGTTVVVVDPNGTAHVRQVETGAEDAAGVQIRSGVHAKELVVSLTNSPIKDGQKVRIGGAGPASPGVNVAHGGGGGSADPSGGESPGGAGSGGPGSGSAAGGSGSAAGAGSGGAPGAAGSGAAGGGSGNNAQDRGSAPPASGTTAPVYGGPSNAIPNNPPQIQPPTPSSVPGNSSDGGTGNRAGSAAPSSPSGGR